MNSARDATGLRGVFDCHGGTWRVRGDIMGIVRVTLWVMGVINLLTKCPSPSK